ncbi:MAG: lytic murein transglycosylase B [Rubrivivax sp.]|nr:lytic murein transglycosylase B [Rubrivivax sp.]
MTLSRIYAGAVLAAAAAIAAPEATASTSAHAAARKRPRPAAESTAANFAGREDVQRYAHDVAERGGLPLPWVLEQLREARGVAAVRRLIMPPPAGTAKNWRSYRAIFVERERIANGVAFWRTHERWLQAASERWGVPPEIVVSILGVETYYGRIAGGFRVLDALATLAFDFPPGRKDRSAFFRDELESLLQIAYREGLPAASFRGSYAGAIGLPQFMPSSIQRWAIDFDDDGHIDLRNNPADAIGSVAHYLASFGWQRGLPTHYDVAVPVDTADRAALLAPDIVPSFSPAQFVERGALLPDAALAHDGPLALVELQNGPAAPTYLAGTSNFYTITRYNWSSYYAMAVIELAEALRRAGVTAEATPAARR